jgi:hypothetical protein
LLNSLQLRSRGSSVGIVAGYGLDDRGSILGRGKILLISVTSRPGLGTTLVKSVPGVNREADHSSPSNAEIKNGGAIPPLPPKSSQRDELIDQRDNCIFTLLLLVVPPFLLCNNLTSLMLNSCY